MSSYLRKCGILIITILLSSCSKTDINPSYRIIAHRGYYQAVNGAENSMQAIEAAYKLGIDGVEIDVRATKDDSLVLVHDEEYSGKVIANSTYEELAKTRLPNGEMLPTLTMCFDKFKTYSHNFILYLDIKSERALELTALKYITMAMGGNVTLSSQIVIYLPTADDLTLTGSFQDVSNLKVGSTKIASFSVSESDLSYKTNQARELGIKSNIYVIETESDLIRATKCNPTFITTNIPLEALQFKYNYE